MHIQGLDHLNLSVRSFDETVDWYGRVFGFAKVEEGVLEDGVRWGVIRSGAAMLCIYEHVDYAFADPASRGEFGVSHFGLRVSDAQAWEVAIEREKLQLLYGGEIRWPHSRAWYVNDPTGYEIEVVLWDADTVQFDPLVEPAD